MSTLNKANKSKMEMNVLANEDGTKISSVLGSHSAVERACSVCPQTHGCAGRTCAFKGSSRKGYCLS